MQKLVRILLRLWRPCCNRFDLRLSRGLLICRGMVLPIQLPTGIHEIQPLEICVDFGAMCGRDLRKGGPTLIVYLSQRMGMLVARFASRSGLERLSYEAAQDQRCNADMASMLENRHVFECGPSAWRLQTGRGVLDIHTNVDLSFCYQPWDVPAPVDLSVSELVLG